VQFLLHILAPGSGSYKVIEFGCNPDPHPQPCLKPHELITFPTSFFALFPLLITVNIIFILCIGQFFLQTMLGV
jgi:hypothetical protein